MGVTHTPSHREYYLLMRSMQGGRIVKVSSGFLAMNLSNAKVNKVIERSVESPTYDNNDVITIFMKFSALNVILRTI